MNLTKFDNNVATMSSLEIAELTGKEHKNVMADIRNILEEAEIGALKFQRSYFSNQNKELPCYHLPRRECDLVVSGYSVKYRLAIIDRWQELEAAQTKPLPGSYRDAIAALLVEIDAKETALRTKAEIGCRREATAMNTASQATKKATALEIQLDRSKEYATVKRMEMAYHGIKFNWRLLKSTCKEMGIDPIDVFDSNYGTVKAYHADVWMETYAVTIIDA